jgi:hypothetical protein
VKSISLGAAACADDLVTAAHPVRLVMAVVEKLDLSRFHQPVRARRFSDCAGGGSFRRREHLEKLLAEARRMKMPNGDSIRR